jgi:hypothetical protein
MLGVHLDKIFIDTGISGYDLFSLKFSNTFNKFLITKNNTDLMLLANQKASNDIGKFLNLDNLPQPEQQHDTMIGGFYTQDTRDGDIDIFHLSFTLSSLTELLNIIFYEPFSNKIRIKPLPQEFQHLEKHEQNRFTKFLEKHFNFDTKFKADNFETTQENSIYDDMGYTGDLIQNAHYLEECINITENSSNDHSLNMEINTQDLETVELIYSTMIRTLTTWQKLAEILETEELILNKAKILEILYLQAKVSTTETLIACTKNIFTSPISTKNQNPISNPLLFTPWLIGNDEFVTQQQNTNTTNGCENDTSDNTGDDTDTEKRPIKKVKFN